MSVELDRRYARPESNDVPSVYVRLGLDGFLSSEEILRWAQCRRDFSVTSIAGTKRTISNRLCKARLRREHGSKSSFRSDTVCIRGEVPSVSSYPTPSVVVTSSWKKSNSYRSPGWHPAPQSALGVLTVTVVALSRRAAQPSLVRYVRRAAHSTSEQRSKLIGKTELWSNRCVGYRVLQVAVFRDLNIFRVRPGCHRRKVNLSAKTEEASLERYS